MTEKGPGFPRKIGIKNGNLIINVPKEIVDWLELHPQSPIFIQPEEGKYGKYISIYNKEMMVDDSETTE